MKYLFAIIGWLSVSFGATLGAADKTAAFQATVQPFFTKYCLRCHDAKKQKGEFRLDALSRDFRSISVAERWGEVMFRVNSGEMPPKEELQPTAGELGNVAEWISTRITEGRAARMAMRGPVAHYRLSRDEYANTIYDLLGVHFDARMPGALNEDPRWHGFDRIGSMLTLSPSHVNRYFAAAETVLTQAFPVQEPKPTTGRQAATGGRWLLFPSQRQGNLNVRDPGLYRIRVQLSALPSFKGRMPRLSIWNNSLKQSIVGQDVVASEENPTVVNIETFLSKGGFSLINEAPGMLSDGHTLSNTPKTIVRVSDLETTRPTGYKFLNDKGESIFPLLLVDWVDWEGPILTDAVKKKRDELFPSVDRRTGLPARPNEDGSGRARRPVLREVRECLARFIDRAWRRPATEAEVDRYMNIVDSELAAGENFRAAYMAALTGVLTSKNFYYIVEGTPDSRLSLRESGENTTADATFAERKTTLINDWELTSRLSFFLWSSMPDDELFAAARAGTLRKPEVLRAQLTRMLADAKISRFTDSFPQQWLQLHKVGMFKPDSELYPDYDKWLEKSMIQETTGFFAEVYGRNLSIREFLSSDWTVMNSRLAMHYGMDRSTDASLNLPGFHRIALRAEDHRGGLLTHASVLSLTSDGTRHRPVHRGVWVSEAIFGRTPPPPPPNVEPLEPTPSDKPKATIRDQLEAHATHATCASCHQKIDPLGFAFDNYDAIGRWRTSEQVAGGLGDNPPVNASGSLPDGRAYNGPSEFKQLLTGDLDRFAEAFAEQLATFALRRVMTIDDAAQIKAIAAASKPNDYRLRTVMESLVISDLFQKR